MIWKAFSCKVLLRRQATIQPIIKERKKKSNRKPKGKIIEPTKYYNFLGQLAKVHELGVPGQPGTDYKMGQRASGLLCTEGTEGIL